MKLLLAMVPLIGNSNTFGTVGDGFVGLYNMVMLKYTTLVAARIFSTHQRISNFTCERSVTSKIGIPI
jgi:hypothetical protein